MKTASNDSNPVQSTWQQDLLASLVVFLVALPLCMGIALASGAPVAAGLVTGIVGGLLVGTFAGSPLQVSGPAAGLTVICGEMIRQNGMNAFGLAVLFAGILQLVAGIFRLGQWFRAVSPAVIHGMLSGIGVLILCGQIHVLVDERPRENALKNIAAIPESLVKGIALPTLDSADIRTSRIDLLSRFNALGGRQRTLRGSIDRALLRMTAPADEGSVAAAAQPTKSMTDTLQPWVKEQQSISDELKAITRSANESPLISNGGPTAEKLKELLMAADSHLTAASLNMSSNNAKIISRSQKEAALSLDILTASLKSHAWAGKIGLLAVIVIFAWQFVAKGRMKLIPAPLLAIVLATLAAQVFQIPILYVDVPDNLLSGLTLPSFAVLAESPIRVLLVYDKELSAQGMGNIVCGCLGVLPMTGVIVRSAANVQAGGKTRLSTILHGVWLLLFSVALVPVLRMIPTSALAGILVYTGFRLIDIKGMIQLWKENRIEAAIFLTTMLVIVTEDLLTGVVTGIVLSAVKLLARFSQLDVHVTNDGSIDKRRTTIKLVGAATFIRLPKLASRLEKVDAGADLHIDVSEMDYIDRACMELLQNWSRQHAATGGQLTIDWHSLHSKFQTNRPRQADQALPTRTTPN